MADTSQGAHVLLRTAFDKDSDAEQKLERPASWGSNTWRQSSISRCSQAVRHEDPQNLNQANRKGGTETVATTTPG